MHSFRTLLVVMAVTGCEAGPREIKDPPVLTVLSPARSLVQGQAGQLVVTGTVAPSDGGDPIEKVLVNNVQATLEGGTFRATIDLREGATLINTVATDRGGQTASDTRAVHAGERRAVGTNVNSAVTVALSTEVFASLSAAAGPLVKSLDMAALLAPLQPMVRFDDPDGEDCFFARGFIDDIQLSDVKISLTPVVGGLKLRAELDGINVKGHVRWSLVCAKFTNDLSLGADRIVVGGTLKVTPNGTAGFATKLENPTVEVTNSSLLDTGIPGEIIDDLGLRSVIDLVISKGAELAMNPLVNQALGALAGPQKLDLLGQEITMQVAPSAVTFTADAAAIAMNMTVLIAGGESSPGYTYTRGNTPVMEADGGFALGVADDLANQMLAEVQATGLLDLMMPTPGGAFDTAQVHMTLPPMISATGSDGNMHVVLGDMLTTFSLRGAPVAKAAINATVDLKIEPLPNNFGVALQLGTPEVHVDVLDDVPNATGLSGDSLGNAAAAGLAVQIDTISKLLRVIPLPAVAGLRVQQLSIGGDEGYVMVRGRLL